MSETEEPRSSESRYGMPGLVMMLKPQIFSIFFQRCVLSWSSTLMSSSAALHQSVRNWLTDRLTDWLVEWVKVLIPHTHTHNRFTALWNLSGTTRVSRYHSTQNIVSFQRYSSGPISWLTMRNQCTIIKELRLTRYHSHSAAWTQTHQCLHSHSGLNQDYWDLTYSPFHRHKIRHLEFATWQFSTSKRFP